MKRILALSLLFVTCLLCLLSCKGCNPDDGRVLPQPEASVTYIGADVFYGCDSLQIYRQ